MDDSISTILYILISVLFIVVPSIVSIFKQKKVASDTNRNIESNKEIINEENIIEKVRRPRREIFLDTEKDYHPNIKTKKLEPEIQKTKDNFPISQTKKINLKEAIIHSEIINKKYN